MLPFAIPYPSIDPVAVQLGPVAIRWYALAYIVGILLGWWYSRRLVSNDRIWGRVPRPTPLEMDDFILYATVGIVIGGRVGYVFFYNPGYYLYHPVEALQVWKGGMSFHGGFLGSMVAMWLFQRGREFSLWSLFDIFTASATFGLFFGRVANFINAELWGRPSNVPWAVIFPGDAASICPDGWVGACARHPSQLYEAGLEGIALFLLLLWAIRRGALARPGRVIGLFLIGYGAARIFVEQFRQADGQFVAPDNPHGHVIRLAGEWGLSMGQVLSLPMLLAGLALLVWSGRRA